MGMEIEQEFQPTTDKFLMLAKDEIMIEFNLFKTENSRGVIGKRAVSFRNYKLNNPIDNEYFKPIQKNVLTENAYGRDEIFGIRHDINSLVRSRRIFIKWQIVFRKFQHLKER
jgi:hypothetical protein